MARFAKVIVARDGEGDTVSKRVFCLEHYDVIITDHGLLQFWTKAEDAGVTFCPGAWSEVHFYKTEENK